MMCCSIDEAIRHIQEDCSMYAWSGLVINRLEYHRKHATGKKPKYHDGESIKYYYTCGECGHPLSITDNYCSNCGCAIQWDAIRCLTGLPLVDAAEKNKESKRKE